jgi:hypothetical protein
MKRLLTLLTTTLGVGLTFIAPAAGAGAQTVVTHEIRTVFNECTGENVLIEADRLEVTREQGDDHSILHVSWRNGTAIGEDTGMRYIFQGEPATVVFNGSDNGSTFTIVDLLQLTAPGSDDDLQVHFNLHVTEVNGEFIVEFEHAFSECRG